MLCFVKSLSWLIVETCGSKLSNSFYRNIVRKIVSCDMGLSLNSFFFLLFISSVIDWLSPKNDGLFGGGRLDIMKSAANGELSSESCNKYKCEQPISHDFVANKKE